MSGVNWAEVHAKLPTDKSDPAQHAKRLEMFKQFDPNNNGYLSLAECDKGVRDILAIDGLFDAKPAIMRAFQAAKAVDVKGKAEKNRDDFIQACEFRIFLQGLATYFEMYVMFSKVDKGGDHRINKAEFTAAVPQMAKWGVKITDPAAEFATVDGNGGGEILFDEFAKWGLAKHLDCETE